MAKEDWVGGGWSVDTDVEGFLVGIVGMAVSVPVPLEYLVEDWERKAEGRSGRGDGEVPFVAILWCLRWCSEDNDSFQWFGSGRQARNVRQRR